LRVVREASTARVLAFERIDMACASLRAATTRFAGRPRVQRRRVSGIKRRGDCVQQLGASITHHAGDARHIVRGLSRDGATDEAGRAAA